MRLSLIVCNVVIQGSVDVNHDSPMERMEISEVLDFCFKAFTYVPPDKKEALFAKLDRLNIEEDDVTQGSLDAVKEVGRRLQTAAETADTKTRNAA